MRAGGYNSGVVGYRLGEKEVRKVESDAGNPGGYLEAFVREVGGKPMEGLVSSAEVMRASRIALVAQEAAEKGRGGVVLKAC